MPGWCYFLRETQQLGQPEACIRFVTADAEQRNGQDGSFCAVYEDVGRTWSTSGHMDGDMQHAFTVTVTGAVFKVLDEL